MEEILPSSTDNSRLLTDAPQTKKTKFHKKIVVLIVVAVVVIGSVGYVLLKKPFSPEIIIDSADKEFFDSYPSLPFAPIAYRSDTLWGEFNLDIDYITIQTVQITPTIQGIAQQFIDHYPDDIYERVNATYMFVASNIKAQETVGHYQYPVTTLQTLKGGCGESAALLASILYAEGLNDVAFVITNGTNLPHAYVTVRLPTPTEAENPVEEQIKGYLDENWIAMDSTNDIDDNFLQFRELDPSSKAHYDIQTIVKVPVFGCVFEHDYKFVEDDPLLGNSIDFQCGLFAFEHEESNNVTFTFQMVHNNVPFSTHIIELNSQENLTVNRFNFKLDIDDAYWENYTIGTDQWYFGLEIEYD